MIRSTWTMSPRTLPVRVRGGRWSIQGAGLEGPVETAPQQGHVGGEMWYAGWRFLIRFVAPLAVGAIIVSVILGKEYQ